jgi:4-hydroxy-2-oxoheptanedioate aldolase
MIKLDQAAQEFFAQRAVGAGFQSVLFVDTRSVEDAQVCIRTVRPDLPGEGGTYGAAARRNWYGTRNREEYVQAIRDVVIVLMIEKKGAVDQLEQILSLGEVDMIQWGGSDYSMSIGSPDAAQSTEVKKVERQVIETCIKMGVPPRAEIGSPDDAAYYLDLGVRHFSLGTELFVIQEWMKTNGDLLRKQMQKYA